MTSAVHRAMRDAFPASYTVVWDYHRGQRISTFETRESAEYAFHAPIDADDIPATVSLFDATGTMQSQRNHQKEQ